ncbi:Cip1-interacting zinc finger protein, partial [Nibea albiflora]
MVLVCLCLNVEVCSLSVNPGNTTDPLQHGNDFQTSAANHSAPLEPGHAQQNIRQSVGRHRDYVQVLDSLRGRHRDYVQVLDSLRGRLRDYVQVLDSLLGRHRDYVQVLDSLRGRLRDYVQVYDMLSVSRCFVPTTVKSVTRVRFPVGPVRCRPPLCQVSGRKWAGSGTGSSDSWPCCSSATTEEERGDAGPDGGSGVTETKRTRLDGSAAAPSTGCTEDGKLTNRERVPGSCDQLGGESCSTGSASDGVSSRLPPADQQRAAEHGEDSKAAEVMKRDVIARYDITPEYKRCNVCKQLCRPFCPVCKRHFRTPRKFVEHMKSAEHKQQVHLEEAQEEELITVDAVGCFEEEEEEVEVADEEEEEEVADEEEEEEVADEEEEEEVADEEEEEEVADEEEEEEVADEEEEAAGRDEAEDKVLEAADAQETHREEYDPHTIYGR